MYEDLVERLHRMLGWELMDYDANFKFADETIAEAADAIEKLTEVIQNHGFLESLIKPRWIPVTERLPEEYIPVLVCFDFKGRKSIDVAELWSDGGFHNYTDEYLTPEGRKHRKGTHWMLLPSTEGLNET